MGRTWAKQWYELDSLWIAGCTQVQIRLQLGKTNSVQREIRWMLSTGCHPMYTILWIVYSDSIQWCGLSSMGPVSTYISWWTTSNFIRLFRSSKSNQLLYSLRTTTRWNGKQQVLGTAGWCKNTTNSSSLIEIINRFLGIIIMIIDQWSYEMVKNWKTKHLLNLKSWVNSGVFE